MSERRRGLAGLTVLLVVAVAAAGVFVGRLGSLGHAPAKAGTAPSGAWFCPHGGGKGWNASVEIANPGTKAVQARVVGFNGEGPSEPKVVEVAAGTTEIVGVDAADRASGTMIEYFGGWVAGGWVAKAGEGERGVAAEPCLAHAGRTFLLADNPTLRDQDAYVVVMNPFASQAIFSLHSTVEKGEPVESPELTDFVLKPRRTVAFHLNELGLLGQPTIGITVQVAVGRVAASSLGVSKDEGIRSVIGVPAAATEWILPGGLDTQRAALPVFDPAGEKALLQATVLAADATQTAAGAQGQDVNGYATRTFTIVTSTPSTVDVRTAPVPIATGRRTSGVEGDLGATAGASEAEANWVALPASAGDPAEARLLLANPASADTRVELTRLDGSGDTLEVSVGAGRTILVSSAFTDEASQAAVEVRAVDGVVVPAFASYSSDRQGYAVSAGVPVPAA